MWRALSTGLAFLLRPFGTCRKWYKKGAKTTHYLRGHVFVLTCESLCIDGDAPVGIRRPPHPRWVCTCAACQRTGQRSESLQTKMLRGTPSQPSPTRSAESTRAQTAPAQIKQTLGSTTLHRPARSFTHSFMFSVCSKQFTTHAHARASARANVNTAASTRCTCRLRHSAYGPLPRGARTYRFLEVAESVLSPHAHTAPTRAVIYNMSPRGLAQWLARLELELVVEIACARG